MSRLDDAHRSSLAWLRCVTTDDMDGIAALSRSVSDRDLLWGVTALMLAEVGNNPIARLAWLNAKYEDAPGSSLRSRPTWTNRVGAEAKR